LLQNTPKLRALAACLFVALLRDLPPVEVAGGRLDRQNRAFEALDIITAFTDLERELASPEGDAGVSAPARCRSVGSAVEGCPVL